jgi:hypothetical protein
MTFEEKGENITHTIVDRPMDHPRCSDLSTTSDGPGTVEYIVADRIEQGRVQYLLKWQNAPHDQDTWEFRSNCDCPELIDEYEQRKQLTRAVIDEPGDFGDRPCQVLDVHGPKGKVMYTVVYLSGEQKTISSQQLRKENVLLAIDYLEQRRIVNQKPK